MVNRAVKKIAAGDKVIVRYITGHRCMCNRMAEMQLCVLREEIMQRFDRVELAGNVVRLPNNFIRWIAEVPVVLHRK